MIVTRSWQISLMEMSMNIETVYRFIEFQHRYGVMLFNFRKLILESDGRNFVIFGQMFNKILITPPLAFMCPQIDAWDAFIYSVEVVIIPRTNNFNKQFNGFVYERCSAPLRIILRHIVRMHNSISISLLNVEAINKIRIRLRFPENVTDKDISYIRPTMEKFIIQSMEMHSLLVCTRTYYGNFSFIIQLQSQYFV